MKYSQPEIMNTATTPFPKFGRHWLAISIPTITDAHTRPLTGKPRIRLTSTSRCLSQQLNRQRIRLRNPIFGPAGRGHVSFQYVIT